MTTTGARTPAAFSAVIRRSPPRSFLAEDDVRDDDVERVGVFRALDGARRRRPSRCRRSRRVRARGRAARACRLRPRRARTVPFRRRPSAAFHERQLETERLRLGVIEEHVAAHGARERARDGQPEAEPLRFVLRSGSKSARGPPRSSGGPSSETRTTAWPSSASRRIVMYPPRPPRSDCRLLSTRFSTMVRTYVGSAFAWTGLVALDAHGEAVLGGERADVVGEGAHHAVERDALELRLERPHRAQVSQMRERAIGLGAGARDEVLLRASCSPVGRARRAGDRARGADC